MNIEAETAAVVMQLSEYWLGHPKARDTALGIGAWWLGDATVPLATIERALAWMRECNAVERLESADATVHYRRRNDRPDVESRLRSLAREPGRAPGAAATPAPHRRDAD